MNYKTVKSIESGEFLGIQGLQACYQNGALSPTYVISRLLERLDQSADQHIWISLVNAEDVRARAENLQNFMLAHEDWPEHLPLLGVPYAVKDNIDVAGMPTTAGCPDFAYVPELSANVVTRLEAAGAILIGKTNIDQFATGLVGTRSPYGTPVNPFNPDFIPGGSSSGSAVAVASGLVSFSLGTDTAGSGRVPAAFNNIVGLKPTRGTVGNDGVVPACRSLDCVSVFALTVGDAAIVLDNLRLKSSTVLARAEPRPDSLHGVRFAVPQPSQLEFFGNDRYESLFQDSLKRAIAAGATIKTIDFSPFLETAKLLYDGPWIAERYTAVGEFIEKHPASVLDVTRKIIKAGKSITAIELFNGQYHLEQYSRVVERLFDQEEIDCLLVPTAPTCYTLDAVEADPITLNSQLGYYTNFVNLLNLCALAVPAGVGRDGIPFGVSLIAPANTEKQMLAIGDQIHRQSGLCLGKSSASIRETAPYRPFSSKLTGDAPFRLVVCGAHMSGLPLNHQLTDLGARLVSKDHTAKDYRFFALQQFHPPRPGLIRVPPGQGFSIEVEIWELPTRTVGTFLAQIPSPLGLGTVSLEDGEEIHGFICEQFATAGATDISHLGSWRNYITST